MIRYGPAGIPLSCKGRTLKDGIEDVHGLALTALQVQLVRPRTDAYPADEDEEVGKTLNQLGPDAGFTIGIEDEDGLITYDRNVRISEEDNVLRLSSPPADNFGDLAKLGKIARRHDIVLSSHTPRYMDLTGNPEEEEMNVITTQNYMDIVIQSGIITNALGGDVVVTNLGPYGKTRSREESIENIHINMDDILGYWSELELTPLIGIEISSRQDVFGSTEEVFELCDDFGGSIVPVLDFAHYQAYTGGSLKTSRDFADVICKFSEYGNGKVWASISNVEIDRVNHCERYLTPLKNGDIKFERLAEALAEVNPDITIISDSPLLEHDAVYMRTLTERVLTKKAAKALKEKRKEEAAKLAELESAAAEAEAETGNAPAEPETAEK